MRKSQLKALISGISLLVFSVAAILPAGATANSTEQTAVKTPPLAAVSVETPDTLNPESEKTEVVEFQTGEASDFTTEELEQKFLGILNINYCYDFAFDEVDSMVNCAALSLYDYAYDSPGYGICVNSSLLSGFVKSLYGVEINATDFESTNAPEGYVSLIETDSCTLFHTLVSVTETDYGYEVLTCMATYYGGSDVETCLVKSKFVKNTSSEFGFNLLYAETL